MVATKRRLIRLASKLNALTIGLILVTAATISLTVILEQSEEITRGLRENGVTLADIVARNAEYGIYTEDEDSLDELLQTLRVNPDIDFAAFLGSDGRVLCLRRFNEPGGGTEDPAPGQSYFAAGRAIPESVTVLENEIGMEITLPVMRAAADDEFALDPDLWAQGEVLGYTVIGLSKNGVGQRANALLRKVIVVTFLASVFGVLATLLLTRRIVRPLRVLHAAIERVSEDEAVQSVDVHTTDEIGDLSVAFNDMLNSLRHYRSRIVEKNRSLNATKGELEKQNKELKQLDRMKDAFISAVSHEMKTPVAKHAMQLEIFKPVIMRHTLEAHELQAFTVMEDSIRRQQKTVQNLLNMSRLEAGKIDYQMEVIVLDELLRDVVKDYRHEVETYGLRIETDIPDLAIEGDRDMLWHAFSNIVSNSIKFRKDDASGLVSIVSREANDHVRIEIHDNGKGMSREEVPKAFSRFFQASHSIEGSGVGLSIARMIIESHRGKIWMDSEGLSKGTSTYIELPVHQAGKPV